jgi:glycosyltransferase involved in cell wall biosynthesis
MQHLPYFLPVSETRAPQVVEARERPYILFVGRIVALKGLDRLLEAFRTYDAVDLVVVGEGDERKRLERSASDLPHVRFLGRKHPSALQELYAGALALVVPSVGYEVFGIVVLEAFAQGTPAIVSDLGALPELIADSGGGLTFRTTDELVEAIDRLRVDRPLRDELGSRGRAAWLERWSEGPHIDGYMRAIADARRSKS